MSYEIRAGRDDESELLLRTMSASFLSEPSREMHEAFLMTAELERSRCAFERGAMVGTLGAYSLALQVPGAVVPTAGTTWVTVRATHRRRGLLRALLAAHIEDAREQGEPLAALWASESSIYGRFGYGCAAGMWTTEIECAHARFRDDLPDSGRLRSLEPDAARALLPDVYARAVEQRPGHFARSPAWWRRRTLDPAFERDGYGAYRYVLYEDGGEARGYLQYRVRSRWAQTGLPDSRLQVVELQALDAGAYAALWRYACSVDLVSRVGAWNRPVDDALPHLLKDPRRLQVAQRDALWLRLLDVPQALACRRYAIPGRAVLEVRDPLCPWNAGSWQLEAGREGATCVASSARPELYLDSEALASIYLGGGGLTRMLRAGRVAAEPGVARRIERLFAWDPAPWCPETF